MNTFLSEISDLAAKIQISNITEDDDRAAAELVRSVMAEFGLARAGSAYTDPEIDYLAAAYSKPGTGFLVAKFNGEVVGTAGFGPLKGGSPTTCLIQRMYLGSRYRKMGLGRKLLEIVEEAARKSGYTYSYLETTTQMEGARRLYEISGYKKLDGPIGSTGYCLCNNWYGKELL